MSDVRIDRVSPRALCTALQNALPLPAPRRTAPFAARVPAPQLEREFTEALKAIAAERGITYVRLVAEIADNQPRLSRNQRSLSSACRLFVLRTLRARLIETEHVLDSVLALQQRELFSDPENEA